LWEVETGAPLGFPLPGRFGTVRSVSFGPDDRLVAAGTESNMVVVWDVTKVRDGAVPAARLLRGHDDFVASVAFAPDGQMLASGGFDRTVRLWDVASGLPFGGPFYGYAGWVQSVAWSPDGQRMASGGEDGTVILWDVGLESWQERACRIANRNLTREEWERFVGSGRAYNQTCPGLSEE
jgi:WD40 repeat protein